MSPGVEILIMGQSVGMRSVMGVCGGGEVMGMKILVLPLCMQPYTRVFDRKTQKMVLSRDKRVPRAR